MSSDDDDRTVSPLSFDLEGDLEEEFKNDMMSLELNMEVLARGSSSEKEDNPDAPNESSSNKSEAISKGSSSIGRMRTVAKHKKKCGLKPKRPLSAYNFFVQKERPKILELSKYMSHVKIGFEDIGRIIGKRWKALTEEGRKEYQILAEKDTIRYRNQMELFKQVSAQADQRKQESIQVASAFSLDISKASLDINKTSHDISKSSLLPTGTLIPETTALSSPQGLDLEAGIQGLQGQSQQQPGAVGLDSLPGLIQQAPACLQPTQSHCQQYLPQVNDRPVRTSVCSDPIQQQAFLAHPGLEVSIPDSSNSGYRYMVMYGIFFVPREAAQQYIGSLTTSSTQQGVQNPVPVQPHQQLQLHQQVMQPLKEYFEAQKD